MRGSNTAPYFCVGLTYVFSHTSSMPAALAFLLHEVEARRPTRKYKADTHRCSTRLPPPPLGHFMRQVLPKHTLEALLVGLCGTVVDDNAQPVDGWGEGLHGRGGGGGSDSGTKPGQQQGAASRCAWTELTMPVMTAALNLKPTLSDQAIAALVRGAEAASEQPKLQVRTSGGRCARLAWL